FRGEARRDSQDPQRRGAFPPQPAHRRPAAAGGDFRRNGEESHAVKRVSPRELLDLRERAWGGRLRGVSLVAEVETRPGHAEQVATVLGKLYRVRIDAGRDPGLIFEKWPACTAVAVTWIA